MKKRILIRTLPLIPYAGTFAVFSACGCGHCPACFGASASMVGLVLSIGTKKLFRYRKREEEKSREERSHA